MSVDDEWDSITINPKFYPIGADTDLPITLAYRRLANGEWALHTVVAESAILRKAGIKGLGLYAGRTFRGPHKGKLTTVAGETVGRYGANGGVVLARSDSAEELEEQAFWYVRREQKDKLFLLESGAAQQPAYLLMDASTAREPFLQRMNDPTRGNTGMAASCEVSPRGVVRARRVVPAFSLERASIDEQWRSELSISYKSSFWKGIDAAGSEQFPLILEDGISSASNRWIDAMADLRIQSLRHTHTPDP